VRSSAHGIQMKRTDIGGYGLTRLDLLLKPRKKRNAKAGGPSYRPKKEKSGRWFAARSEIPSGVGGRKKGEKAEIRAGRLQNTKKKGASALVRTSEEEGRSETEKKEKPSGWSSDRAGVEKARDH